jgi:hypothetical protein
MARTNKLKGCYRRVLIFLLVSAMIILAAGIFVYQRFGGVEGARYWMAERALNKVEEHLLQNRPDGVSEAQIRSQFEKVRRTNGDRRTDLIQLYRVLKAYQTQFQRTKPSTPEVEAFLSALESTIIPEDNE